MKIQHVEPGTTVAPDQFYIQVAAKGPYLVYGKPRLSQQFLVANREGVIWTYEEGAHYATDKEPTALCRCGASANKPYCDGAHVHADWDPTLTAPNERILDNVEQFEGPTLVLTDNKTFCAFARFCDAGDRAWNLVGESDDPKARELTIREANLCPGARLSAWDLSLKEPFEPHYEPSLGLIEDPQMKCSGPLWVRGGIPIRTDEFTYEVRNRVALCRCGQSANKPYCDGTHTSMHFHDHLPPK